MGLKQPVHVVKQLLAHRPIPSRWPRDPPDCTCGSHKGVYCLLPSQWPVWAVSRLRKDLDSEFEPVMGQLCDPTASYLTSRNFATSSSVKETTLVSEGIQRPERDNWLQMIKKHHRKVWRFIPQAAHCSTMGAEMRMNVLHSQLLLLSPKQHHSGSDIITLSVWKGTRQKEALENVSKLQDLVLGRSWQQTVPRHLSHLFNTDEAKGGKFLEYIWETYQQFSPGIVSRVGHCLFLLHGFLGKFFTYIIFYN